MGALINIRGQKFRDRLFDASGTITTGGTPQLILPQGETRSSLIITNTSSANMFFEFGAARATATLSGSGVASCAVTNAGFGYSLPPAVEFYGGAWTQNTPIPTYTLQGLPDFPSPSSPAKAHCVMTGAAGSMTVSSIVIDSPGSGYCYPPFVFLVNRSLDPFGCAVPSGTVGILLLANGGSYTANGSVCTTDQISVYCATTSSPFVCKFSL